MGGPLQDDHLKKLKQHKYSVTGKSLTEPILQLFWNWLVNFLPLWLAPNTLTLVGMIINIISTVILIYYSPDGKSEIPVASLLFAVFGLFVYQTLDALDGKQARRTNTSSPLGELFDHGCDSFTTVFVSIGFCLGIGLGDYPMFFYSQVAFGIFVFYVAHWQCYVTGTVLFGTLDVTEAQLSVMGVYLFTSIFGIDVWKTVLPVIGVEWKVVAYVLYMSSAMLMFLRFAGVIMNGGVGRHGSSVANTSVVFPMIPITLVSALFVMIAVRSPSGIFADHPCLYLMTYGMVSSKIINKLVVAHMSKSELSMTDSVFLSPALLFFNQYFGCPIPEVYLLWACYIIAALDVTIYSVEVIIQIANYLDIFIFRTDSPADYRKNDK